MGDQRNERKETKRAENMWDSCLDKVSYREKRKGKKEEDSLTSEEEKVQV